ncbi:MAG TPA: hypothetical protein VGR91_12435 [Stellaceae bacterium]|nr:hypothetical protein [Stellaceae bacterium]
MKRRTFIAGAISAAVATRAAAQPAAKTRRLAISRSSKARNSSCRSI